MKLNQKRILKIYQKRFLFSFFASSKGLLTVISTHYMYVALSVCACGNIASPPPWDACSSHRVSTSKYLFRLCKFASVYLIQRFVKY